MLKVPLSVIIAVITAASLLAFPIIPQSMHFLMVVPLMSLLAVTPWMLSDLQSRERERHRRNFLEGRCVQCGYDLRSSHARCPECGAPAWSPAQPLAWPDKLWPSAPVRFVVMVSRHDVTRWMLEQRGDTDPNVWGPDSMRRRVAAVVLEACGQTPEVPFGRFLPSDPFEIVSSDVTTDSFTAFLWRELRVRPSGEELVSYEGMTLDAVVNALVQRGSQSASAVVD
jgi:hypothetical protein